MRSKEKDLNYSEIKAKSSLNHSPVSEKKSEEKKQLPQVGKEREAFPSISVRYLRI